MAWKLNRGEWTEAFVFLKLLADGRIYAGDANLSKIAHVYMNVLKCIRRNSGIRMEYRREEKNGVDYIIGSSGGNDFVTIESYQFEQVAHQLLNDINNGGDKAFGSPRTEAFLCGDLNIVNIKEKCVEDRHDDKTDILLQVKNSVDSSTEEVGFSVKSHLGSAPTLFNYSGSTRLVYRIDGCDDAIMYKLNAMKNRRGGCNLDERIKFIKNTQGLGLTFMGSKISDDRKYGDKKETGPFFQWNLEHFDVKMLEVLSTMLLSSYGYLSVKPLSSALSDVVDAVATINPLNVHSPQTVYPAKYKDFLYCSFAGLTGSKKWDGTRHINGGYIDVKKDGEILYYRAISDNQFTSFLYNNIKLERPEHGSYCKYTIAEAEYHLNHVQIPQKISDERNDEKKGDYGYVYLDATHYDTPCYCLDINFSLRFKN